MAGVGCVVATAFISLAPAMAGGQVAGGPGLLRTPDGRPDMSGIWQVMNGAAWNIQDQNAAPGPHSAPGWAFPRIEASSRATRFLTSPGHARRKRRTTRIG